MERVAVLCSGGLDSGVLLASLAKDAYVFPIYVESGFVWEAAEKRSLATFLDAVAGPHIAPLATLAAPVDRIYGQHWSLSGEGVPDWDALVDADYLPGRNVLLLGPTAIWCALNDMHRIALGSLLHNPYADATPQFFADYSRLLSVALSHQIEIVAPYRGFHKSQLVREHSDLPLDLTLTCVGQKNMTVLDATGSSGERPLHCGACIKCAERHEAFVNAGVPDRTRYATAVR